MRTMSFSKKAIILMMIFLPLFQSCENIVVHQESPVSNNISRRRLSMPSDTTLLLDMQSQSITLYNDFIDIMLSGETLNNAVLSLSNLNEELVASYAESNTDMSEAIDYEKTCINYVLDAENESLAYSIMDILSANNISTTIVEYLKCTIYNELNDYSYSEFFCEQIAIMSYLFSIGEYQPIDISPFSASLTEEEIILLSSINVMFNIYHTAYTNEMTTFLEIAGWEDFNSVNNEECYEQFREGLINIAGWATLDAINLGIAFASTTLGTFGIGAPVATIATIIGAGLLTVKLFGDVHKLYSDYNNCISTPSLSYSFYINNIISLLTPSIDVVTIFANPNE